MPKEICRYKSIDYEVAKDGDRIVLRNNNEQLAPRGITTITVFLKILDYEIKVPLESVIEAAYRAQEYLLTQTPQEEFENFNIHNADIFPHKNGCLAISYDLKPQYSRLPPNIIILVNPSGLCEFGPNR